MKFIDAKIRPVPSSSDKSSDKTLKGAARIYVNKEVLLELTGTALENGKLCYVEKVLDSGKATTREASLWASADPKLSRGVVQMSKPYQDACDFKLGDTVKIIYTDGKTVPEADVVVMEDVAVGQPAIEKNNAIFWEWAVKGNLMGLDDVFPGLVIKRVAGDGIFRNFRVTSVNGSVSGIARFLPASTKVRICTGQDTQDTAAIARPAVLKVQMIPGLEPQIRDLNKKLRRWHAPFRCPVSQESCGLVLAGGHGTGKTMLLNQICESGWGTVHRIQSSDKLSSILETFQKARDNQPSLVVMDAFERLIDKDRSNRNAVIQAIADFLDKLASDATARNERPKVMVLAACLDYLNNIPEDLKEVERFDTHVNLPLPDAARRRAILSSFGLPLHPETKDRILDSMSEKTHAYNGKDLKALAKEAAEMWEQKLDEIEDSGLEASPDDYFISEQMTTQAIQVIRPSAMHDINLKPPPVHWDDIGGQEEVKRSLQQALALSTESKENLRKYMSSPPRGFLLYGPPGCSKTMAAQALATESDLNFFAVKGAELLNMYVGESERQVRQLFQRAREAAPSIIFFDEIDSIGGQRSGFGSASSGGGGSSGLNVLTTLLNEMQGFELTQGVLVLAATNRPQALDPALLRPGRFDKLVYVGPPNKAARASIFRNWLANRPSAPGIDVDELARQTEGASGAETVAICEGAGGIAYWRDFGKEDRPGVTMEDLREQIQKQPRMITPEMLASYEAWRQRFLKEAGFVF